MPKEVGGLVIVLGNARTHLFAPEIYIPVLTAGKKLRVNFVLRDALEFLTEPGSGEFPRGTARIAEKKQSTRFFAVENATENSRRKLTSKDGSLVTKRGLLRAGRCANKFETIFFGYMDKSARGAGGLRLIRQAEKFPFKSSILTGILEIAASRT